MSNINHDTANHAVHELLDFLMEQGILSETQYGHITVDDMDRMTERLMEALNE